MHVQTRRGALGDSSAGRAATARRAATAGRAATALALAVGIAGLAGCGKSTPASAPSTTTVATTTTTTVANLSNLTVDGVRPGVLQAPFYPQVTVGRVTCGVYSGGGRFVRIDLPAGSAGTPGRSVMTKPTAVIVVPSAALLIDPQFPNRTLYAEAMRSIATASQGAFVLTLTNDIASGGDGLTVEAGAVQINGDYQCPTVDVAYPGT